MNERPIKIKQSKANIPLGDSLDGRRSFFQVHAVLEDGSEAIVYCTKYHGAFPVERFSWECPVIDVPMTSWTQGL